MKIIPQEGYLVVRPLSPPDTTPSGLALPPTPKKYEYPRGIVVAISRWPTDETPRPETLVLFDTDKGWKVRVGDEELRVIPEDAVFATLEDNDE